jgi:hypothetical protein
MDVPNLVKLAESVGLELSGSEPREYLIAFIKSAALD